MNVILSKGDIHHRRFVPFTINRKIQTPLIRQEADLLRVNSTRIKTNTRRLHERECFAREGKAENQTIQPSDHDSGTDTANGSISPFQFDGTLPEMSWLDRRPRNRSFQKTRNALLELRMATPVWRTGDSGNGGSPLYSTIYRRAVWGNIQESSIDSSGSILSANRFFETRETPVTLPRRGARSLLLTNGLALTHMIPSLAAPWSEKIFSFCFLSAYWPRSFLNAMGISFGV